MHRLHNWQWVWLSYCSIQVIWLAMSCYFIMQNLFTKTLYCIWFFKRYYAVPWCNHHNKYTTQLSMPYNYLHLYMVAVLLQVQCNAFEGADGEVSLTAAGGLRKIPGLTEVFENAALVLFHPAFHLFLLLISFIYVE